MKLFDKIFKKKHVHDWKFEMSAGVHGIGYMVNDCDNVPMVCKCGARGLAKWRKLEGMIEIKENKENYSVMEK